MHYEIVQALESEPSKIGKEQIVYDAFHKGEKEFFIGASLAYDCLVTFGVSSKIPGIEEEDLNPQDMGTFTFNDFLVLTTKLRNRQLTGNAARDTIRAAAESCHGPSWNDFYRRVLQKDLRCGATDGTINRVLKKLIKSHPEAEKLMIPVFECQLAEDGMKPVHMKKQTGRVFLDGKMDGCRLLTVMDKEANEVRQYTRNGKENTKFTHITKALTGMLEVIPGSIVLDGEIVDKSFQTLMTQFNRDTDVDTSSSKLALFDIIPLEDFRRGICNMSQENRNAVLCELEISGLLNNFTKGSVYVLPKILVDLDTEAGQETMREFNNKALIELKIEGIMLKKADAPYECRRSTNWLKIKPNITIDLIVIDIEEGKEDGKYVGMTGALVCAGEDSGYKFLVKVGSGLSDEQRKQFWENKENIIGSLVEVKADAVSKAADSDTYSLRFPRFERFREIKKGEGKI